MTAHTGHWICSLLALTALFNAPQARPDGQHELLFFLSAGPSYHDVAPDDGPEDYELFLDADVLYSYLNGRFRLLGEYAASSDELELEPFDLFVFEHFVDGHSVASIDEDMIYGRGDRIGQLVFFSHLPVSLEQITDGDMLDSSIRGLGGFGSTGR